MLRSVLFSQILRK